MTEQDKRWQIHRHLAQDTDERLQLVRNAPKRIMLIGADADISRSLLAARYPDAVFEEYDPNADFLKTAAAARKGGFWQKLTGKTIPQHCQSLTAPLPEAAADTAVGQPQPQPRRRYFAGIEKLGRCFENRRIIVLHALWPRQPDRADRPSEL